jgi:serine-type D-Ala-D-Ala carboxypeptidase (penicillin-binding protein 5/6)
MRLPARLMIAALALTIGGSIGGCSGGAGLAYAGDSSRPPAGVAATGSAAAAAASAHATPTPTPVPTPPGPRIVVTGAPRGIKAKAGILADATTGQVLWSSGGDTERPIASITKVMTALIVLRAGNLSRPIKIPKSVIAYVTKYGANSAGLVPGQVLTAGELLHALLLVSACDAAYALATAYGPGLPAFIAKMNATAAQLGLTDTHFTSPDGLPYPTETSTYSTPAELLKLGELAMQSATFRSIVGERFYNLPKGNGHGHYWWGNSNELIGYYPGAIGIKTGFTDAAGHCLLFEVVRGGRTLIGVVLGSPPTGPGAGAQDAAKILNWGFSLKQTA